MPREEGLPNPKPVERPHPLWGLWLYSPPFGDNPTDNVAYVPAPLTS